MSPIKRAFTLIELLIVFSILALLAVIIFPVFSSALRRSQTSTCLANTHQIQQSISTYMSDYDGKFPVAITGIATNFVGAKDALTWRSLISPYIQHGENPWTFVCPALNVPDALSRRFSLRDRCGYALNENLEKAHIQNPALTVVLVEARPTFVVIGEPDNQPVLGGLGAYLGDASVVKLMDTMSYRATIHQGGCHYSFADGHVKWYRPEMIRSDEKNDGINSGFGI